MTHRSSHNRRLHVVPRTASDRTDVTGLALKNPEYLAPLMQRFADNSSYRISQLRIVVQSGESRRVVIVG